MEKKTRIYEIWSEGYCASGDSGKATYHGFSEGKTFRAACKKFAENNTSFNSFFDEKNNSYWGCRLFDSKEKAMKSFG